LAALAVQNRLVIAATAKGNIVLPKGHPFWQNAGSSALIQTVLPLEPEKHNKPLA
jgi:hypothetical protein